MYLKYLRIRGFRIFDDIQIKFKPGVNVLIGENNSGKSTIIDALRICLGIGKSDTGIYIQESDLYIDKQNPHNISQEIQFDLNFLLGDDPLERRCFYDFLTQDPDNLTSQIAQIHLKFILVETGKKKYFKRLIWGGENEGQQIPYEALQEIFYIYLDPLRDAINGLKPYSYDNKTSHLFNQLTRYRKGISDIPLDDNKKAQLARQLYSVFENAEHDWVHILCAGKDKVNEHLEGTGITYKNPNIEMSYVGREYSDVVRGIVLRRPIYEIDSLNGCEQKYFELFQNGLGENNLIYASVILGDLINRCKDNDLEIYNALLVEEPEAHLHPQYQNTFFKYLNKLKDSKLQIFITSHSPTITAKCDLDNLIVFQKQKGVSHVFSFLSLEENDFSVINRRYLQKFLDTTKSQLFFANGVILVEGICEAILIPLLAKKYLNIDLEKNGIEIVNVGGVAFEHFAKLFNNNNSNKRLFSKCSIITDSDPKGGKPISDRAIKASNLKGNNLNVCLASHTFEADLFFDSIVNKIIMRDVYRTIHPQTNELKSCFDCNTLLKKLESNKDKAEFALELYNTLLAVKDFTVPNYIKEAVQFVVT